MWLRLTVAILSLLAVVACAIEPNVSQDAKIEFRAADVVPFEGALEAVGPTGDILFVQPTPAIVTGDLLAIEGKRNEWDLWDLMVMLTPEGATKMEQLTKSHIGKPIAIFVDGELTSAPIVQDVMSDGIVISGGWDQDEVREILKRVRSDWQ